MTAALAVLVGLRAGLRRTIPVLVPIRPRPA